MKRLGKTTQGNSLYSYLQLNLAKPLCFSFYCVCVFFNKSREQKSRTGSAQWQLGRRGQQIMYTHVNKCKNNKIKNLKIVSLSYKENNIVNCHSIFIAVDMRGDMNNVP
jgi:hypothetical protein